ncbi:hypothetical protein [Verrucomicrobium spinosum]|nr:hypothetical protein [Verrucomicrobium spinosum]
MQLRSRMKLQQGQVWKQGERYIRIVHLERLSVEYKDMTDLEAKTGKHLQATKKEFCRLIKGAELLPS